MEKVTLNNTEIELFMPQKIMYTKFIGDINEDNYKEIWNKGVDLGVEHKVEKFLLDQSEIGRVSFTARGWVILKMLPRIKNELGKGLNIGVISSKNMINKSGVNYLISFFENMVSVKITFYPDVETAKKEM